MTSRPLVNLSIKTLGPVFKDLSPPEAEKTAYDMAASYVRKNMQDREVASIFLLQLFAATKMSARSRVYCARAYFHGVGTRQSYKLAARWARQAAVQGDAEGQNVFAYMLSTGLGLTNAQADQRQATEMYRRSALQGYDDSLFQYGIRLYEGIGVDVNKVEGKVWLARAADQKNVQAVENLSCIQVFGVPANRALALNANLGRGL